MTDYKVKLDIFEGPLDLLLHLIKEEELDIKDIPIARITKQYFEYLEVMKELNLDIAGEFLVMASTLTYIKSRTLLPRPEGAGEEDEGVDPREELIRRLLEYKKYKEAAGELRERENMMTGSYAREFLSEWNQEDPDYLKEVSIFQLLGAFREVLKNSDKPELYSITLEDISVTERMNEIMETLTKTPKTLFTELFDGSRSRMEIIGTFLAVLELMKQGLIRVFQEAQFGSIWVQLFEGQYEERDLDADKPEAGMEEQ